MHQGYLAGNIRQAVLTAFAQQATPWVRHGGIHFLKSLSRSLCLVTWEGPQNVKQRKRAMCSAGLQVVLEIDSAQLGPVVDNTA